MGCPIVVQELLLQANSSGHLEGRDSFFNTVVGVNTEWYRRGRVTVSLLH